MVFRSFKKFAKRGLKVAGRFVKKRYFKGKGFSRPNVSRMIKDVAHLKHIVNAEKKFYEYENIGQLVAQFNGATGSGVHWVDCSPIPTQNGTDTGRIGDSIKVVSCVLKFQMFDQSAKVSPMKLRILIIRVKGATQTVGTAFGNYLQDNTWTDANIKDYSSIFNPDYRSHFDIIADKRVTVKSDQYSGQTNISDKQFNLKLSHHMRYTNGTQNVITGQLLMAVLADSGNYHATIATTSTNVPVTAALTGVNMNYNMKWYFFDN